MVLYSKGLLLARIGLCQKYHYTLCFFQFLLGLKLKSLWQMGTIMHRLMKGWSLGTGDYNVLCFFRSVVCIFYVPDEVTRNEGEEARDKSFGFKNLNLGIFKVKNFLSYFCGRKFISLYVSGKLSTYSSPKPTLTCFSLRAKCWISGGVWQFPRNVYMTREFSWKRFSIQMWYIFRLNKACWKLRHKAYSILWRLAEE